MTMLAEQRSIPRALKPEEQLLERMLSRQVDPACGILKPVEVVGRKGEFKSLDIFRAYTDRLDRQADVLERSCGTKRKSAVLKDAERAAQDLDDSEEAVDTTPEIILNDVTVEDLIRHQDPVRVFALCYRHNWTAERSERTKQLMVQLLTSVLELKLLTPFEFLKAIGFSLLTSRRVPEETLHRLLEMAVTMGEGVGEAFGKGKQGKPFQASHFLAVFKPELMVECFDLVDLNRVLLAVAEKCKWLPAEKPKELPADTDDSEDRATRRPAAMTDDSIDEPGTPAESIAPPAAPAPAPQANEDDVEIVFEPEGGTGTHAAPPPETDEGDLPSPPPLPPARELTPETVNAAFDDLIQGDQQPEPTGAVPLSRPGDPVMVTAATPEAADQWKGRAPAGGTTPGSGSRSPSSLKPR